MHAIRSETELADLKAQWYDDASWDLEDTAGFGAHRDELHAYRLECEHVWRAARTRYLLERADVLGVPGNCPLIEYIETLEGRVKLLEGRLARIEGVS